MSKFLVTYHGGMTPDPSQMEQVRAAFGAWLAQVGDIVVDPGAPVHAAGQVAEGEPATATEIGGYSILEADDVGAVISALRSHPFVARGGTLQIHQAMG